MSKLYQNQKQYKKILQKQDVQMDRTCQFCFTPTHDQILLEQSSGIKKLDETRDFYKPMMKSLTCVKCKRSVHELCHNDSQKKKSYNNFQCILCIEKDHKDKPCAVCNNIWGMKKIFYEDDEKKYIHLICAYYDPNYHFNSFKNKEITKMRVKQNLEDEFEKESTEILVKKENLQEKKECTICDRIITTQAHSKCKQCNQEYAHISCLLYAYRKIIEFMDQSSTNPQSQSLYMNPLPCLNLQEPENDFISGFKDRQEVVKYVQNNIDFKMKDKKDKQIQLEYFIDYFQQQLKQNILPTQIANIPMTCSSCRNERNNNEQYCCGSNLGNNMVMCDICNDWVHETGCDKNQNTTIFNQDKIDVNYKYQCLENLNYENNYIYICKNCEDIAFYFNKMTKERSIQIIQKPKQFLNYYMISLKLENLLKQKKDSQDDDYDMLSKNLLCNVYYKQTDLQLYQRLKKEFSNFLQSKDIGFYFSQFTSLFQKRYDDINLAYEIFSNKNRQFINQQEKTENEEDNYNIELKKQKKILRTIIPDSQRFLENPCQRNLHQIKFNLQQILQNKDIDDSIAFFVRTYIDFMKLHFIQPLDERINKFNKFFENYSQNFNEFYNKEFEQQLRKYSYNASSFIDSISLKEYVNCKIPCDKYDEFIKQHENIDIFKMYIDNLYDNDCSYQNLLNQDFEYFSVGEIEQIIERIINCDFRPPDHKMYLVEKFLEEYVNFLATKQDIDKLSKQIEELKPLIKTKNFLKESKNLDLFIIREHLENIYLKNKYGQKLIQHYIKPLLDKKQDLQRKSLDQYFVRKCEQTQGSLKKFCKSYLIQIDQQIPIISEKSFMYLKKCNQEYQVEKILLSQKVITLENLKYLEEAYKDKQHMGKYTQIEVQYFLTQYNKSKQLIEDYINQKKNKSLNTIKNDVDEMFQLCQKRRINSSIIQDYKENINLCEKISYLQTKSLDLDDQGLSDNCVEDLIQYFNQNQSYSDFKNIPIKKPKNFLSINIEKLYNLFRQRQIKYIFLPEYQPKLSLADQINCNETERNDDLNQQMEISYFNNFKKRVQEFKTKVYETAIYLIKKINIYEFPAQTFKIIQEVCIESNAYDLDDSQIVGFLKIFSQIRVQLKIQEYVEEFLDINLQDDPCKCFEDNSKVYEFLYKQLRSHQKNRQNRKGVYKSQKLQLWNFDDSAYEDKCIRFIKHYECREELEKDIKKMQNKIKNVQNQPLTYINVKLKEKEVDKMIHRMGPFKYFFKIFYKYITDQKKLLCTTTKLYDELSEKLLNSNISQLLLMQDELENATKLILNLHIKNDQIENNHALFSCLIDFIQSNGESFTQFQKFYEEIFLQLNKLKSSDLQQYKLVQSLNSLQKEFEQVKKNLEHLQNKIETHECFKNYLMYIDQMVNPELNHYNYFCRFDYPIFEKLQDEIKICKQLLNNQYDEFFRLYYKPDKHGFVGAIHLSDQLKQNIEEKLNSVNSLKKFITQIQQDNKQLSLEDKIGLYNYVQKVFKQCVNVIQNDSILQMFETIESNRKMIQDYQKIIQEELKRVIFILDCCLKQNLTSSSIRLIIIPDLDKKIQDVIACDDIVILEKIQFLLFCWHYKIIRHLYECTIYSNHRDYVQFYQSKEFKELKNYMDLQQIIQNTQIRCYCIMSMKFVTNYVLCCIPDEEIELIQSKWQYKHIYQIDWDKNSKESNFYDKNQSIESMYRPSTTKFQNLGKQNFLRSVQFATNYISNYVETYILQINEEFEERATGQSCKKQRINDTNDQIQNLFKKYIFQNKEPDEKYRDNFQKNFSKKSFYHIEKLDLRRINKFKQQIEKYFKTLHKKLKLRQEFFNRKFDFEYVLKQIQNNNYSKHEIEQSMFDNSFSDGDVDVVSNLCSSFTKKKKGDIFNEEEMKVIQQRREKCQPIDITNPNDCSLYIIQQNVVSELKFKKVQIEDRIITNLKFYTNQKTKNLDMSQVELYLDYITEKNDNLFSKIGKRHLQHLISNYSNSFILGWIEDNTPDRILLKQVQQLQKNQYLNKSYTCKGETVSINFSKFENLHKELWIKIKQSIEYEQRDKNIFVFIQFSSSASSYLSDLKHDEIQIKQEHNEFSIEYSNDEQDEIIDDPEFQIIYKI